MPLKLVPPKAGRTKNWHIRGTHLGRHINESAKTSRREIAAKMLKQIERAIERGTLADPDELTFDAAALSYMQAGGERRFLSPLIKHFGKKPLSEIDQRAIDQAADALYPDATAATRNRQAYSPASAVLKHAGVESKIRRPKGWRGQKSTRFLTPDEAFALFAAADAKDAEFGIFLRTLCYTGMRLGEALRITIGDVNLAERSLHLPKTKNGHERAAHLPPAVVTALACHPDGLARPARDRLFRFRYGGRLYNLWKETKRAASLSLPERQGGFHVFCHTWATWMKRYAELEDRELVETDRWRDLASVARYGHLIPSEASRRADLLPVERPKRAGDVQK